MRLALAVSKIVPREVYSIVVAVPGLVRKALPSRTHQAISVETTTVATDGCRTSTSRLVGLRTSVGGSTSVWGDTQQAQYGAAPQLNGMNGMNPFGVNMNISGMANLSAMGISPEAQYSRRR